jgi:hypothetical protein
MDDGGTPLWLPLVIAALGFVATILGTIGGVLITQRRSDQREQASWDREREREHERWGREDAARTFEQRRTAYTDFYESLREMAFDAYNHGMGLRDEEELGEWQLPTYRKLQHLRVYANEGVADAASEAYSAAWWWGHNTTFGDDESDEFSKGQERYDAAEDALLEQIRTALAIPSD